MRKLNFEKRTLRLKLSSRGGGIEVRLDNIKGLPNRTKMTAYQNYLGGGMLGAIASDCNLKNDDLTDDQFAKLEAIKHDLKMYFAYLMGIDDHFDSIQKRPYSAY